MRRLGIVAVGLALVVGVMAVACGGTQEQVAGPVRGELAFVALGEVAGAGYEIYVVSADGSGLTNLTENTGGNFFPAWSPDGNRIAFESDRSSDFDVYIVNRDGTGLTNMTNNPAALDTSPAWSPDGTRIAFASSPTSEHIDEDTFGIYVMSADGSGLTRLTTGPGDGIVGGFSWSPDGSRIAFARIGDGSLTYRSPEASNYDIYVVNADGTGLADLTDNPAADLFAAWSPDGNRIAFESNRSGDFEIYVMSADGSNQNRVTNDPAEDGNASWSPDGARIAFNSDRNGDDDVYVVNLDGSDLVRLTGDAAPNYFPRWSPDGTAIAFQSGREVTDISVMKADGSGPTNVSPDLLGAHHAVWSPIIER